MVEIPTLGHEQSGRRTVLVLSPKVYNRKTGLCVVCAATHQRKGYGFEVVIDERPGRESVVLADQMRNIDWKTRRAERIRKVPPKQMEDVLERLSALLFADGE